MLANFNAGFPPLKYVKKSSKKNKKASSPIVSGLNIQNILNKNNKPMIVINKPYIDVIDNL
jgi:hypothetical protein